MPKPRLSPTARIDVEGIRDFSLERFGVAVAARYVDDMRRAIHAIGERPLSGRDDGDMAPNVRSMRFRSHRIYYRIEERSVLIVRVLHHAQDAAPALGQAE